MTKSKAGCMVSFEPRGETSQLISSAEVREFQLQGFVAIRNFLPADEVAQLRAKLEIILQDPTSFFEDEQIIRSDKDNPNSSVVVLKKLQQHSDFEKFISDSRLSEIAGTLFNASLKPLTVNFINKHRDAPVTQAHQDAWIFARLPSDALTIWIALDSIDDENGCLRYVHGSHWKGLRAHYQSRGPHRIIDYGDADRSDEVAVHVKPGDAIVHHSFTIHSSSPSVSDRSRWALAIPFIQADSVELQRTAWMEHHSLDSQRE